MMSTNIKINHEDKLTFWNQVSSSVVPFDHKIFLKSGTNQQEFIEKGNKIADCLEDNMMSHNIKIHHEDELTFWNHVSSSIVPFDHFIFIKNETNQQEFIGKRNKIADCKLPQSCVKKLEMDVESKVNLIIHSDKDFHVVKPSLCKDNTSVSYSKRNHTCHLQEPFIGSQYIKEKPKLYVERNQLKKKLLLLNKCSNKSAKFEERHKMCVSTDLFNNTYRIKEIAKNKTSKPTSSFVTRPKLFSKPHLRLQNDKFTKKKYVKVRLRRIDKTVEFLSCLNLCPVWKNSELYKSPVKIKKLSKLRNTMEK